MVYKNDRTRLCGQPKLLNLKYGWYSYRMPPIEEE